MFGNAAQTQYYPIQDQPTQAQAPVTDDDEGLDGLPPGMGQ
jgi:hypothetical protein